LSELLGKPVGFIPASIGERVVAATKRLAKGQVLLLENLRFHPEEEANDPTFAKALAKDSGATWFVQDGFGVVHRAHASTDRITEFLPSVAGLLLESEVSTITSAMENPKRPLVAVLGGAKISDKIALVERFVDLADQIIIGGAMANTFLAYKGVAVGKSLCETDQQTVLANIYKRAEEKLQGARPADEFIALPQDVVVADSLEATAKTAVVAADAVPEQDFILDIGSEASIRASELLAGAGTVIWNGTLGMAEREAYARGSAKIAETLAAQPETNTIVGGGDTADFVRKWSTEHHKEFGYISTGGGAGLELMAGERLPGVEALLDK
jgi:phosphoglycerate kinase